MAKHLSRKPTVFSILLEHEARGNEVWKEFKEVYNITEDVEILREKRRAYHVNLLTGALSPMIGAMQLLDLLKEKHIHIALATGSSPVITDIILEKLHIKKYFDVIVHGWDFTESKPHPQPFLLASKRLQIPVQDCIAIEDSLPGVLAAKAAGIKVIAVPTMYSKTDDFSKANRVVQSLEEVDWELLQSL